MKAYEWHDEWVEHHVPGLNFSPQGFMHGTKDYPDDKLPLDMAEKTQVYFSLYFAMTGMHALHMVIGISLLTILTDPGAWRSVHGRAMWRRWRILGCTGTLSILCGYFCSRCCI